MRKKKKGGKNRQKSRLKLARQHEKISSQRNDFIHKESRKLAGSYSIIAVEKLSISNMVHNRYLSKSISDAGWRKFIQALAYKVEETGGKLVEVEPKGTSQHCICGNRVEKSLAVRIHKCNKCDIEMDRDTMSAMIIKHIALTGTTAGSAGSNAWEDESALSSMNQELPLHSS
ncbi:MAG: transposase [Candidatus Woesearchaeota archaeon]